MRPLEGAIQAKCVRLSGRHGALEGKVVNGKDGFDTHQARLRVQVFREDHGQEPSGPIVTVNNIWDKDILGDGECAPAERGKAGDVVPVIGFCFTVNPGPVEERGNIEEEIADAGAVDFGNIGGITAICASEPHTMQYDLRVKATHARVQGQGYCDLVPLLSKGGGQPLKNVAKTAGAGEG